MCSMHVWLNSLTGLSSHGMCSMHVWLNSLTGLSSRGMACAPCMCGSMASQACPLVAWHVLHACVAQWPHRTGQQRLELVV